MNDFVEVAKQVPALGILCFLVWQFLSHLQAEGEKNRKMREIEIEATQRMAQAVEDLRNELLRK